MCLKTNPLNYTFSLSISMSFKLFEDVQNFVLIYQCIYKEFKISVTMVTEFLFFCWKLAQAGFFVQILCAHAVYMGWQMRLQSTSCLLNDCYCNTKTWVMLKLQHLPSYIEVLTLLIASMYISQTVLLGCLLSQQL